MFGDYQTARLMQASSSYPADLHQNFVGIPQDPIGFRGGLNYYLYGLANTLNTVDPLGLLSVGQCANPINAAACAAAGISARSGARSTIRAVAATGGGGDDCECKETKTRDQAFLEALEYVGDEMNDMTEVGWDQYNYPPGYDRKSKGWAEYRMRNPAAPYGYRSPSGAELVEHPFPDPKLPDDQEHLCPHFHAKRNLADRGIKITYKPGT